MLARKMNVAFQCVFIAFFAHLTNGTRKYCQLKLYWFRELLYIFSHRYAKHHLLYSIVVPMASNNNNNNEYHSEVAAVRMIQVRLLCARDPLSQFQSTKTILGAVEEAN